MSEKILEKIKKLFLQAESENAIGNAEAARVFAEKAQQLLDKYNLELSDIDVAESRCARIDLEPLYDGLRRLTDWQNHLLTVIAETNGCTGIFTDASIGFQFVVGRAADRRVVIEFYKYFERLAGELADRAVERERESLNFMFIPRTQRARHLEQFRDSFLIGFVMSVGERLKARHAATIARAEESAALVLVRDKTQESEDWVKENMKNVDFDDNPKDMRIDEEAYIKGASSGREIALTNKVIE